MRRKMLRLLSLVPTKKSLLLAQKALGARDIDDIMEEFREINVSPVCISRRQEVDYLGNIYDYLIED
jgi:flagellar biosynthesis GTPase FlhF